MSFLGAWVVMTVAMMLPSLIPMLRRYRQGVERTGEIHLGWLTGLVGAGYFSIWTVIGMALFPLGAALTAIEMDHPALMPAIPIAISTVVLIAGAIQLSSWKARQLFLCRRASTFSADAPTAWRHGLHVGLLCSRSCANLMAILLVIGVMDAHAMAVVTVAITLERLVPSSAQVARAIGALLVAAGLVLVARIAALG